MLVLPALRDDLQGYSVFEFETRNARTVVISALLCCADLFLELLEDTFYHVALGVVSSALLGLGNTFWGTANLERLF